MKKKGVFTMSTKTLSVRAGAGRALGRAELEQLVAQHMLGAEREFCRDRMARRVLLIPPDYTRLHSNAGIITQILYKAYNNLGVIADIMPAVGTHMQMSAEERREMFGDIPAERFLEHDWRSDCVSVGSVPGEYAREVSEGLMSEDIPVELDRRIADGRYARIYSIGQVVPHEVVGMANHAKNLFVGCGGRSFIGATHLLGAVYGMERIIGRTDTPPRRLFDYAAELISGLPVTYIQTVVATEGGEPRLKGVFLGEGREPFELAAQLARQENITRTGRRFARVVAFLDPREFRSTWVGNKAIYRTRMMIEDGGELIILAPGVETFGENPETDAQIRQFGYRGRKHTLDLLGSGEDISPMTAAHLIHGSSDGRFRIIYCTEKLSEAEVRAVGFDWMPYKEAERLYGGLAEGANRCEDGVETWFVGAPALGLWTAE